MTWWPRVLASPPTSSATGGSPSTSTASSATIRSSTAEARPDARNPFRGRAINARLAPCLTGAAVRDIDRPQRRPLPWAVRLRRLRTGRRETPGALLPHPGARPLARRPEAGAALERGTGLAGRGRRLSRRGAGRAGRAARGLGPPHRAVRAPARPGHRRRLGEAETRRLAGRGDPAPRRRDRDPPPV